jgi:hypothetical protein
MKSANNKMKTGGAVGKKSTLNELLQLKKDGVKNISLNGFTEDIDYVINLKLDDSQISKVDEKSYMTLYATGGGVVGFERLPKSVINNELYVTFNNFKSIYDSLMNGDDFDEKRFQGIINDLVQIKSQAKKFNNPGEIKGTDYMANGGTTLGFKYSIGGI